MKIELWVTARQMAILKAGATRVISSANQRGKRMEAKLARWNNAGSRREYAELVEGRMEAKDLLAQLNDAPKAGL